MWIFGAEKAWKEMNDGGDIKIPRIFFYIMKYITPTLLLIIMIWWFVNDALPILMLKGVNEANIPYIWGARLFLIALIGVLFWMVHTAWKNKGVENGTSN